MPGVGAAWSCLFFCLEPEPTQFGRSRSQLWDLEIPEPAEADRKSGGSASRLFLQCSDIWLGQNSEDLSFAVPGSVLPGRVSAATGTVSAFSGTSRAVRHPATAHVACVSQVSEPDTSEEQGNILDLLEGFRSRVARLRLQLKF